MHVLYILAVISIVEVDCLFNPKVVGRYRYDSPTVQFPAPPPPIVQAVPAYLNIPTGPVISPARRRLNIQNVEVTSTPEAVRHNLPLFIPPPPPSESVKGLKVKPLFPLGHTEVSPYYADPDGNYGIPVPPDTQASDLTDDKVHLCPTNFTNCDQSSPWRPVDGTCNNLAHPHYGSANQPMPRLLGAKIDSSMVRILGEDGSLLPNPRSISIALNLPARRSSNHNLLIMQIGQFVDHDNVLSSGVRGPKGESRDCKSCKSWTDPACMPIPIPSNDPFFNSRTDTGERNCLPFTRNVVVEGAFNTIDPLNFNTAFLDLSTVYGSDHCNCDELRLFRYGLMRMELVYDVLKGLPPAGFKGFEECRLNSKKCMQTGDVRSNEHMTLLILHTIFLREHNRLAEKLQSINNHWDDERLFQEARRINIAQYQHITYQEYIPALIGFSKAREYGLQALSHGYYTDYDQEINPGIVNEFAGAAYRIGHSMIPDAFPKFNEEFQFAGELPLRETFHNPQGFGEPRQFDECMRGLLGTRLPALDLHFEEVIKRHLFEVPDKPFSGEDLLARNIARGRDFGFPGYVSYVQLCGVLSSIETWEDLYKLIDPYVVQNYLQKIYKHPKDIDLFVGGMSENQSPGALVGPTFSCIIANQFINLKKGDRFWYENESNGLTLPQLDSIRKTSLWSRILCQNLNEMSRVPYYSTLIPIKSYNPLVECDRLQDIDLSLWTEHKEETQINCVLRGRTYSVGEKVNLSACSSCFCNAKGKVSCAPETYVNCRSLSEIDRLDEACQLLCGMAISGSAVDHEEDTDGNILDALAYTN